MSEKIRVLIFRPEKRAEEIWIMPTHDVLTRLVGGEILMRNPMDDGTVIICKKEIDEPEIVPSRVLRNNRGSIVASFFGTIIVAGLFMKAGELDSLTDQEVEMALRCLERPELEGGLQKILKADTKSIRSESEVINETKR